MESKPKHKTYYKEPRRKSLWLWVSQHMTLKVQPIREKVHWTSSQLKLHSWKIYLREWKKKPYTRTNKFPETMSNKGPTSKIYKVIPKAHEMCIVLRTAGGF